MKINGTAIPALGTYVVDLEDLVDANRTANNGTMSIKRKATKRKIQLSWKYLTLAQNSALQTLTHSESGGEAKFQVEYEGDPLSGTTETRWFYSGPSSSPVFMIEAGQVTGYRDVKMNFIEI